MNEIAQFEFNGKKLYDDYDFIMTSLDVDYPKLNRITQTVPYFNGTYDFTNLYGSSTWSERVITVRVRHKDTILRRDRQLNRITQTVPYFNGTYDFTNLYGSSTWSERVITVRVRHKDTILRRDRLHAVYDMLAWWLLSQQNSPLKFENIRGIFTGRVVSMVVVKSTK